MLFTLPPQRPTKQPDVSALNYLGALGRPEVVLRTGKYSRYSSAKFEDVDEMALIQDVVEWLMGHLPEGCWRCFEQPYCTVAGPRIWLPHAEGVGWLPVHCSGLALLQPEP